MTSPQLNQDIRTNLLNISRIIHEAGENEIGHLLDRIIRSPDQIGALHDALSKKLKRRKKNEQEIESALNKRRHWFRNFLSRSGERLKHKDVEELARITKGWDLSVSQINALLACSTLWASYPALFWHGGVPDQSIIRSCFNDLERMREVDPLRRRILLITLSNQVQQFVLHEEGKAGARVRKHKISSKRHKRVLPAALHTMTEELWPNVSSENQGRIKDKIKHYSRAGWKWQQIAHTWLSLSFQDSTVRGFERHSWTLIEVEAINLFTETLPQYRIRSCLEKAFDSIVTNYARSSSSHTEDLDGTVRASDITTDVRAIKPLTAISAGQSPKESEVSQTSPTTIMGQSPDCTSATENNLPRETADVTIPNDPSFEDTQAASILSSIPRNPLTLQSCQGMPPPDGASDLSPLGPTDPLRPVSQGSSWSPNVTTQNISQYPIQAIAEPRAILQHQQFTQPLPPLPPAGQTPAEWTYPSTDFARSISRQDDRVFELAPFSLWGPGTYEDLDWGAALREFTFGDPSLNGFASLEWDLLIAADGEDDTMIASVTN